jgi:hypothetical protein
MTQERALEVQEQGARTEYPMTQVEDVVMFDEGSQLSDDVEVPDEASNGYAKIK